MGNVLWRPDLARRSGTQMAGLAAGLGFAGAGAVEDLRLWSVAEPEAFWSAVWDLGGVVGERGTEVLADAGRMPGAKWFPDARLNFAENLLCRHDDGAAIVFVGEDGRRLEVSWAGLQAKVRGLAAALRAEGVGVGDRVAGYLPNVPEAVIAMLATSAIGAVWSSTSPDFGKAGVLDRFGQIAPKVLFATDGYLYAGKRLSILDKVAAVANALPSLRRLVVCPFLDEDSDLEALPAGTVRFDDFLVQDPPPLAFARLPFDHPLYVLYSSGTTGKPKAIVHGSGGVLLQHLKEHRLHTDLRPDERLFYFTTCGWMMWNWMATALASRATLVLFDGSPFHPRPETLWDVVQNERVAVFGTSAKYLDACKKAGLCPKDSHDLSSLKAVLSTGSPLAPESFEWVYAAVKDDLQLASISGGTDIVSCFVLGNPAGPVRRGEIQMRGLGLAVEVWNEAGEAVVGEKGELVCTKPFPAMPVGFWDDPEGVRYHASYFGRFAHVWCHGDYAEITPEGGVVIHGRSDTVLNPGGVRIGTAEIYRQVEQVDEVLESVCVGQDWQGDVRVILFVRLRDGVILDEALKDRIKRQIRQNCTPRHVPAKLLQVEDIPRTLSGKITETAVRDAIHGRPVKNTEALANPQALRLYQEVEELQS